MNATQQLHNLGQSLWLDNITRDLLNNGTLERYIAERAITGLTSNPTIFDHAIKNSSSYDRAIREYASEGKSGEELEAHSGILMKRRNCLEGGCRGMSGSSGD